MASNTSCAGAQCLDPPNLYTAHAAINKPVSSFKAPLWGTLTCWYTACSPQLLKSTVQMEFAPETSSSPSISFSSYCFPTGYFESHCSRAPLDGNVQWQPVARKAPDEQFGFSQFTVLYSNTAENVSPLISHLLLYMSNMMPFFIASHASLKKKKERKRKKKNKKEDKKKWKKVAMVSGKVSWCLLFIIIGTASLWLWLEIWLWNTTLDHIAERYTNCKQVFQDSTMTRMILGPVMYTDTRSACSFHLTRIRKSLKTGVFKTVLGQCKNQCFSAFACCTAPHPQHFQAIHHSWGCSLSDLLLCPAPKLGAVHS